MSRKRHKPEEIVSKLRQVDVLVAQGTPVADAVRSIGVTEVSCDRKLATALQYSPAAGVSGLPTAGPGGVRARLRGLAGCAIPTSFAGQKPRSAKTNPALTFTPDHTIGADHLLLTINGLEPSLMDTLPSLQAIRRKKDRLQKSA